MNTKDAMAAGMASGFRYDSGGEGCRPDAGLGNSTSLTLAAVRVARRILGTKRRVA